MNGKALELTLLRAAASPEMRADNGEHDIVYAVAPFESAFADSNVVRQGLDLNVPATVASGRTEDFSLVTIDAPSIILDEVKPAQDGSGDLILRFYESRKTSGTAHVRTAFTGRTWTTDLLENKEAEIANDKGEITLNYSPFELITVRVELN